MDERLLQIRDYQGEGFQPLVHFGAWRVAILRSREDTRAAGITKLERHMQTDEVFVLMAGQAVLLIAGDGQNLDTILAEPMAPGKLYNVRQAVWHGVLLSRDASILIVENRDTAVENSQYSALSPVQRALILDLEKRSGI